MENAFCRDGRRPSIVVTAEDIAERHGENTDQYHDPRGPAVPQDADDDDEREERCDRGGVSCTELTPAESRFAPFSGLLSTLPAT